MTASKTASGSRRPAPKSAPPARKLPVIPLAVGAFLVLAVAIAVIVTATSGGGGGGDPEVAQVREVRVSGTALPALPAPGNVDPALGQAAPVLRGTNFDGSIVETAPAPGQRRLLVFLAHWCPHCRAEVPRIVEWNASGVKPADLAVTAVSTGVDRKLPNWPPSSWLEREKWPFAVLVDDAKNSAASQFGLSGYPFLVLLDADGKVVARASGEKSVEELQAFATIGVSG